MATLTIRLFGGLTVEYDGIDHSSDFSGRLRALLAMLLLQPALPRSRQSVAFALWPESSEKQARANLRKLILLLRAALGPNAHRLVVTDQTLTWRSDDGCWLDTELFVQTLAAANQAHSGQAIELLSQACEIYHGALLPDCYDEWIVAERESLRDRYISALEQLATLNEAEGRYAEAMATARRLLQHDPIYERGHLQLIRLQALMNDRTGALQSYHRCATLLRRELGVDPSPAMEVLYRQLLDPELPAPAAPPVERPPAIPLVGRQPVWQQLLKRWKQAQSGRAHFTLITGEAGIGKSRLAEELMMWVERQGHVAAHARAYSSDRRNLVYAPIAALLRVPAIRGELPRLQPYWLTEIARLLPELLLERAEILPPQPMLDDWQRHHLFAALTQALLPKRLPRLLVIDDLQWCDSETLAWLPHLLEHAKHEQLLVVGTVRSEEFADYDALDAMCETLRRRNQLDQIDLDALETAGIVELARHVVGQSLVETEAHWLAEATEGNPLFVIEIARLLHDQENGSQGRQDHDELARFVNLPKSILDVIEARLARLSKSARALAEVAATIGRSFTLPVLTAAASLDEEQLVDALDELWERRIIRERDHDAYDFSHDRVRESAYANISTLRRRFLHKRVASAIVETQRGALDEVSGQLGHHFEEANDRLAAIESYLRATQIAAGQYAHAEALHYLDRILALALPGDLAIRFEALYRRDRILALSGTLSAWEENLRGLCRLAERAETDVAAPDGESIRRRAVAAERSARLASRLQEPRRAIADGLKAVAYAAMTGDLKLQALCLYTLSVGYWHVSDFEAATPYTEQAIALARQTGDLETLANALELQAQTYMFNGGSSSAIEVVLEECLANYEKLGSLVGRCQILTKIGYVQCAQGIGSYDYACKLFMEALEITERLGTMNASVGPLRNLGVAYTCMGNYAAAEECLERAQARLNDLGEAGEDATILNYKGFLYLGQGRLDDALAAQQKALARLTTNGHQQWRVKALTALAWIHMRRQEPDEAMVYAELSLDECRKLNEQRQAAYTHIVRGILRTERGDLADARADFEEANAVLSTLEMPNRRLEAQAGIAYLEMLEGNQHAALCAVHAILAHLEMHPVDFTEDVCQLLLSCKRILHALDPAALPRLCHLIDHHLSTRTATLDNATRNLFRQIPAHQELRQATLQIITSR